MGEVLITIKIGRHSYNITEYDVFMDNGNIIQLLTQSKEVGSWGSTTNPVLSKRVIKEMSRFDHIKQDHKWADTTRVFSIKEMAS